MTDTNAKLAKAMGWKVSYSTNEAGDHLCASPCKLHSVVPNFSTSHNAFHAHVLPELERRGLLDRWAANLRHRLHVQHPDRSRTTLVATASPKIKCEAALAVMGGGDG